MTDAWGTEIQSWIQKCYTKSRFIDRGDGGFGDEDDIPLSVWLQQNNIEQSNDALNIDEHNNFDTNILTSGIFYT